MSELVVRIFEFIEDTGHFVTTSIVRIAVAGLAILVCIFWATAFAIRLGLIHVHPYFFVLLFAGLTVLCSLGLAALGQKGAAKLFGIGAVVSICYVVIDTAVTKACPGLKHFTIASMGRVSEGLDRKADIKDTPAVVPCTKPYFVGPEAKPAYWVDPNENPLRCYDRAGKNPETREPLIAITSSLVELIKVQQTKNHAEPEPAPAPSAPARALAVAQMPAATPEPTPIAAPTPEPEPSAILAGTTFQAAFDEVDTDMLSKGQTITARLETSIRDEHGREVAGVGSIVDMRVEKIEQKIWDGDKKKLRFTAISLRTSDGTDLPIRAEHSDPVVARPQRVVYERFGNTRFSRGAQFVMPAVTLQFRLQESTRPIVIASR